MIQLQQFVYSSDYEIIARFKELISPNNEKNYKNSTLNAEFRLICQYLDDQGYQITQFPNFLHTPSTLQSFAYDQLRAYIQIRRNSHESVRWDERRKLISDLTFVKQAGSVQPVPEDLQDIIRKISLRDATWEQQTDNEKLRTIADVIENLLKLPDGKFLSLDETDFYGMLTNDQLRNFRKQLQVFRHSHEQALESRDIEFDDAKKKFLVHLGIVILIRLNETKRRDFNE